MPTFPTAALCIRILVIAVLAGISANSGLGSRRVNVNCPGSRQVAGRLIRRASFLPGAQDIR